MCCCLRMGEGGLLWGLDEDWDWGEVLALGRRACVTGRLSVGSAGSE